MIDHVAFKPAWKTLLKRFGREWDNDQSLAYYEYLTELMTTDEFLAAIRSLWASSTFFPRPADFLIVGAGGDWALVLKVADLYTPPASEWVEYWKALSDRGRKACEKIGGVSGMRQIYEHDVLRLKKAWEQAYEQTAAEEALALPMGIRMPALSAGS